MVNDGKAGTPGRVRRAGGAVGRSGRPRAGEERLSRETILQAALRIVDDEGLEAMTMRRLAATLGVNPMSIYHHLPNKAAVFTGLTELVFADLNSTNQSSAETWQEEVVEAARGYRNALRAHPNLALQVLADAGAVSDVVVVTGEPFYRALDRAGLAPREIFEAVNTLIDFIHGFSLGEASVRAETFELAPDLLERVSRLEPGRAPVLSRVVEELGVEGLRYEFDDGFEIGLSLFVDGIAARFGL